MVTFILIFLATPLYSLYTTEPTVKLLEVDLFGARFPVAASEYRTEVTGGRVITIYHRNIHNMSLVLRTKTLTGQI
jgi:hypothetical protein